MITVSNLVPRASLLPQFQSDSKMVAAPYLTWAGGGGGICQHKGEPLFPQGYHDWEKIVCMRNEKIEKKTEKKLTAPEVHQEKMSAETT